MVNELRAYPNPFTDVTYIELTIEVRSNVRAIVYDLNGRMVKELYNGVMYPGVKTLEFNATDLPGGFYIGRISTGEKTHFVRMIAK